MNLTVRGIGRLLTMTGPVQADAAVVIRDGRVAWTGPESALPADAPEEVLDAGGACVVPGFVDAHTHLVFAGVRREEFVARLAGQRYDGGGIRTTVAATRAASTAELVDLAAGRAAAAVWQRHHDDGDQDRLRAHAATRSCGCSTSIAALAERTPLRLEPTYLGAHVVPEGRDRAGYVDEVVATLPAAAAKGARWCDVFCDQGVFTVAEARHILTAAREQGLGLRIHAEEIAPTGAAALAAELGCASADHLEHVSAGGRPRARGGGGDGGPAAHRDAVAALAGVGACSGAARGGGRARAGVGLQPGDVVVRVDALRDPAGVPGDGALGGRGVPGGDARCGSLAASRRCRPPGRGRVG